MLTVAIACRNGLLFCCWGWQAGARVTTLIIRFSGSESHICNCNYGISHLLNSGVWQEMTFVLVLYKAIWTHFVWHRCCCGAGTQWGIGTGPPRRAGWWWGCPRGTHRCGAARAGVGRAGSTAGSHTRSNLRKGRSSGTAMCHLLSVQYKHYQCKTALASCMCVYIQIYVYIYRYIVYL